MVATRLNQRRFGTLLADLLTAEEGEHDARTGALRFDIPLLSRRMAGLTDWAGEDEATTGRPVGLFGASTGAAAALIAAAARPERVRAVVSRGGGRTWPGSRLAESTRADPAAGRRTRPRRSIDLERAGRLGGAAGRTSPHPRGRT